MENLRKLKETILKEYPRMEERDTFAFTCGAHLECFNKCCADVNIFLTPYDVLRMRKALSMESTEFLAKHTLVPFDKKQKFPVPLLQMNESELKECPFVDPAQGCTIYADRPWPCRMYPIGMASPGESSNDSTQPFYFIMKEDVCCGLGQLKNWTVKEWIEDQGAAYYIEFGDLFKELTLHPAVLGDWTPNPKHLELYWMSLYNLDRFRTFIFESSFLNRFKVGNEQVEAMHDDDEELLKFGFRWVRMALFGEPAIPIAPESEAKARAGMSKVAVQNG